MRNNIYYMQLALEQAKKALGITLPNPAVGAVIIKNQEVVGIGYTQKAGFDHAEIQALKAAGAKSKGAEMYVTLEPCCHFGKTPPCTQAIIKAGILKVVGGISDPNPLVNGQGFNELQEAGILVEREMLDGELLDFYRGFDSFISKKRPLIDLKIAQSSDGYIAGENKEQVQISGLQCKKWMHFMRSKVDGVLIGGSTMIHDNPSLTIRCVDDFIVNKNPIRFVMTRRSELSDDLKLWDTAEASTVLFGVKVHDNLSKDVQQIIIDEEDFSKAWDRVLKEIYNMGLHRIMVECGANLASKVIKTGVWDRFFVLTGGILLNKGYSWNEKMPSKWSKSIKLSKFEALGKDYLTVFENLVNDK